MKIVETIIFVFALFLILFLIATLFSGCSTVTSILNQTEYEVCDDVIISAPEFEVGAFWYKFLVYYVVFEDDQSIMFMSLKEQQFWTGQVTYILYIKLPTKIKIPILFKDGIKLPSIIQYQIIDTVQGR